MKKIEFETPTDPDVYWEAWIDPFAEDDHSEEDVDDEDDLEDFEEEELEELESLAQFIDSNKKVKQVVGKIMMTPLGAVPLAEQSLASKYFKLWVGHTNFKLRQKHIKMIDNVNGVESLDIMTNHRFRVSIGKLFKDRDVMANIRDTLVEDINQNHKD
jgi:hypothetical protein